MKHLFVSWCACALAIAGTGPGAGWSTYTDPVGFRIDIPPGWQAAGDRTTGKAVVTGPAGQQAIIWPVFLRTSVDPQAPPSILKLLAASAGFKTAWTPAPAPVTNAVRLVAAIGDRTVIATFAWVGSSAGTAGYLYITAAPAASYRSEAGTLGRILESFRAAGPPVANNSGADTRWVHWADQKEDAFSLEVPAGWTVTGGAFRFAPLDVRKTVQAAAPDGGIRITSGDSALAAFTEPTRQLAMFSFREGSWYSPGGGLRMLVRRYMPGIEFAREYVSERARGCAGVTFTGARARPDVDAPVNRLMSGLAAAGGMMRIQSGEVTFTAECQGRPVSGYYFAGSLQAGAAGMPGGIWHVEYLYGYVAAPERAAEAQKILSHMLVTYADNPQWLAMQQNVTAASVRIAAETQEEVSKIISSTFAYKDQVRDEMSRRQENVTMGTVDLIDPVSGRQIKIEDSSRYYWMDNRGVIVGTQTDSRPGWDFQQMAALP